MSWNPINSIYDAGNYVLNWWHGTEPNEPEELGGENEEFLRSDVDEMEETGQNPTEKLPEEIFEEISEETTVVDMEEEKVDPKVIEKIQKLVDTNKTSNILKANDLGRDARANINFTKIAERKITQLLNKASTVPYAFNLEKINRIIKKVNLLWEALPVKLSTSYDEMNRRKLALGLYALKLNNAISNFLENETTQRFWQGKLGESQNCSKELMERNKKMPFVNPKSLHNHERRATRFQGDKVGTDTTEKKIDITQIFTDHVKEKNGLENSNSINFNDYFNVKFGKGSRKDTISNL